MSNKLHYIGLCDTYFKLLVTKNKSFVKELIKGITNIELEENELVLSPTETVVDKNSKVTFFDFSAKSKDISIVLESENHKKGGYEYYDDNLTEEYLLKKFKNKKLPIKSVLLDQSIINMVTMEAAA